MPKLAPYFFKISTSREDVLHPLGCYHSADEAFVAFKKKYGEKNISFMRGNLTRYSTANCMRVNL